MLRLTRDTDYAIRIILALAKHPPGSIIPSRVVRQAMDLPEAVSIQIISRLAHLGLINTYPGRKGGIQLAHPPQEISLYEIVKAMEGPLVLSECLGEGHPCRLSPDCPVKPRWADLQNLIEQEFNKINFRDLVQELPHLELVDVQ